MMLCLVVAVVAVAAARSFRAVAADRSFRAVAAAVVIAVGTGSLGRARRRCRQELGFQERIHDIFVVVHGIIFSLALLLLLLLS